LNIKNVKIIEVMELKITASKFHEILPCSSKVISGGHRQTGDLISLL
jgi:hypothetical protein